MVHYTKIILDVDDIMSKFRTTVQASRGEFTGNVVGDAENRPGAAAMSAQAGLVERIRACRLCADRFAATDSAHAPRPVAWFRPGARILIAGQAPGARVHASGKPFTDPSGDRLRHWLGLDEETFYDRARVAIVPMAFCFPGYEARGADLPPPPLCARTWHDQVMQALDTVTLRILVGGHAHRWHLRSTGSVTDTVARWRDFLPGAIPLPHPSWRNTGWLKRNPLFETELLPVLRARVREALT
jgi:uracil-DNA glycosylase